jgi:hypothetical protein
MRGKFVSIFENRKEASIYIVTMFFMQALVCLVFDPLHVDNEHDENCCSRRPISTRAIDPYPKWSLRVDVIRSRDKK